MRTPKACKVRLYIHIRPPDGQYAYAACLASTSLSPGFLIVARQPPLPGTRTASTCAFITPGSYSSGCPNTQNRSRFLSAQLLARTKPGRVAQRRPEAARDQGCATKDESRTDPYRLRRSTSHPETAEPSRKLLPPKRCRLCCRAVIPLDRINNYVGKPCTARHQRNLFLAKTIGTAKRQCLDLTEFKALFQWRISLNQAQFFIMLLNSFVDESCNVGFQLTE